MPLLWIQSVVPVFCFYFYTSLIPSILNKINLQAEQMPIVAARLLRILNKIMFKAKKCICLSLWHSKVGNHLYAQQTHTAQSFTVTITVPAQNVATLSRKH